jgi:O-antigen/teichoic acid export membrane protein
MSALTLVILLRSLSTSDFAFVVLLLSVGQFLGSAATGGIRLRYTRLEAERVSRGHEDPSAFHSTVLTGSGLVVAAGILGLVGATALGVGKDEGERLVFVALTTGFTLVTASIEMTIFHYQAQLSFVRAGVIEVVRSTVILLLAFGAAVGIFETGAAVALAFDVGVGIMALFVTLPVALSTRGAVRGKDGRFGFGRETAMLTVYSLASAGWAYLDVFLVAALLNDVAVASYGVAIRYISVVMGPVPALIAVLRVRTSQHDMVDSEDARRRMMARWVRQTFVPALIVIGGAAIAAAWAIPLVDRGRYPLSVPIFQILLAVAFVGYLLLPTAGLLIAQKRYTTLAWVNASALAINVVAAVIAAPLMGVIGVAVAGTVVGIAQAGTVAYLALRKRESAPPKPSDEGLVRKVESVSVAADANAASSRGKAAG